MLKIQTLDKKSPQDFNIYQWLQRVIKIKTLNEKCFGNTKIETNKLKLKLKVQNIELNLELKKLKLKKLISTSYLARCVNGHMDQLLLMMHLGDLLRLHKKCASLGDAWLLETKRSGPIHGT